MAASSEHSLLDLTARENQLVEAVTSGREFVCSELELDALAECDDAHHCVRSDVVRELLTGRRGPLDPKGVRISRAKLVGALDLDHVKAVGGLSLQGCILSTVSAEYAKFSGLDLSESRISSFHADGVTVEGDLKLEGAEIISNNPDGALRLILAQVTGQLICDRMKITNYSGPGAVIDSVNVKADLFIRDAELHGEGENGAARMAVMKAGGQVVIERSTFSNETGPALAVDGASIGHNFYLQHLKMEGFGALGALRMLNLRVSGQMILNKCAIVNHTGPAINADGLDASMDLILRACDIRSSEKDGALRLPGSKVGRQLDIANLTVVNLSGPAVQAEGLSIGGSLFFKGVALRGAGEHGALRLTGARIGHRLLFRSVDIAGVQGPAVQAESIRVDENLVFESVKLRADCGAGAVQLSGSTIGKKLAFEHSEISNSAGTAFRADNVSIGGDVDLSVTIENTSGSTAIEMPGAKVGGQFLCGKLEFIGGGIDVLDLKGASVGSNLTVPVELICPGFSSSQKCYGGRMLDLDDCKYAALRDVNWKDWLHLIRFHSRTYHARSYQQLAAVERSAGDDGYANRVLIEQQWDRRTRAIGAFSGKIPRFFHGVYGIFSGFGYLTSRLVGFLIVLLVLAGFTGYMSGQIDTRPGHKVAERVVQSAAAGSASGVPCSLVELVGLGFDRGLPLGSLALRSKCDLDTSTRRGSAFLIVMWMIQSFMWLAVTLVLASYTGLVKKLR